MEDLSRAYGRLLDSMMWIAAALLFAMTMLIGADVALRNTVGGGLPFSAELSEDIIYLVTLLAAPWLLRRGQHIRVDIVLRVVPRRLAWLLEWAGDLVGLVCCLFLAWYGLRVAADSYGSGALSIKTLVTPEWWILAPLPIASTLLAIEFLFRMRRLALSERGPRDDAVSAA